LAARRVIEIDAADVGIGREPVRVCIHSERHGRSRRRSRARG
jgi:hypothetical protein